MDGDIIDIYVTTHTSEHTYIPTRRHSDTHPRRYTYAQFLSHTQHINSHITTHIYILSHHHTLVHAHHHTLVHLHTFIRTSPHIYIYIYIYIYTFTHSYTHI